MLKQLSNMAIEEHIQTAIMLIIVVVLIKGIYHFYDIKSHLDIVETRVKSSCDRLNELQRSTDTIKEIIKIHDERYDELRHTIDQITRQKTRQDSIRETFSDVPSISGSSSSNGERSINVEP